MKIPKSELTFKTTAVFEKNFTPAIDAAFCVVSRMMFFNRIDVDGTIKEADMSKLRVSELWSYIYYLFYYNSSSVEEFVRMKERGQGLNRGKASALLFYRSVQQEVSNQFVKDDEIVPFDVNTLAFFVNKVVLKYKGLLRNPVVDFLQQIINNKDAVERIRRFSLMTGREPGNVVVVTDPEKVKEADILVEVRGGSLKGKGRRVGMCDIKI